MEHKEKENLPLLNETEKEMIKIFHTIFEDLNLPFKGLYLVGGFVRDKILNKPIRDYDFAIFYNIFSEFSKYVRNNKDNLGFTDYTEITLKSPLVKGDKLIKFYYMDIEIEVKMIHTNILKDSYKRDFTINAIYFDIFKMKIYDFHNGLDHLQSRIIKTINSEEDTFKGSFDRYFRLARFATNKFTIDKSLSQYVLSYFKEKWYKDDRIKQRQIGLQIDRVFNSDESAHIFKNLVKLNIINYLHNRIIDPSALRSIYKKTYQILKFLDILFKKTEFYQYIKDCLGEGFNYQKQIQEVKKISMAYVFLQKDFETGFKSIEDVGFKFDLTFDNYSITDQLLQRAIKGTHKEEELLKYFNRKQKYPFLGIILIAERWGKEYLKKDKFVKKIIESKYFKNLQPPLNDSRHSKSDTGAGELARGITNLLADLLEEIN